MCCVVWLFNCSVLVLVSQPTVQMKDHCHRGDIDRYWYVVIGSGDCVAQHKGQLRQWDLNCSAGNTFGCCVSKKGELHLYHNGRDVGVSLEGLPTDQPLWGFVILDGGWKVEANYIIAMGEAVWCDVLCKSVPCLNL